MAAFMGVIDGTESVDTHGNNDPEAVWRSAVFVDCHADCAPGDEVHPRGQDQALTVEAPELNRQSRHRERFRLGATR